MGTRPIVETIEEEKEVVKTIGGKEHKEMKTWKYFKLGAFEWIDYVELRDRATDMAKGLLELGANREEVFNIYAATR